MTKSDLPADAPGSAIAETQKSGSSSITRRDLRRAEREFRSGARTPQKIKPVRSLATIGAVLALLAGVAIPAYAATTGGDASDAPSAHEEAQQNAQSLSVDDGVKADELEVSNYAATTPEEIAEKKAEEEAAKRAKEAAKAAAAAAAAAAATTSSSSSSSSSSDIEVSDPVEPVDGAAIPLPVGSYYISRTVGSGHEGADLVAPAGTTIYAAKSGTVVISTESVGGYGVGIKIQHDDGTTTMYGHMTYGSRLVSVGDRVEAGQPIGAVGNTGHSFGAHLHFEYRINGAIVDPVPYFGL